MISDVSFTAFISQNYLKSLTLKSNSISVLPYLHSARYTIESLNMNSNNISVIDDGYFANFTSLRTLTLTDNKIYLITRERLKGLAVLQTLKLSGNQIAEVDCNVLYDCIGLIHLSVGSSLTTLPCVTFSDNHTLEVLDLSSNRIRRVLDTDRSQLLSRLINLDVTDNGLLSLQNIVTEMPSLETLAVGWNPDLEIHADLFLNSPNLTTIISPGEEGGGGIKKAPHLGSINSLIKELDLAHNSLVCIDIHHISDMVNLTSFNASYNELVRFPDMGCSPNTTGSSVNDIKFPALDEIRLDSNELIEFPLLPDMPLESSISLRYNKLSNFPPERMALLEKVESIDMGYNDATIFPDFSLLNDTHLNELEADHCKIGSIPETHIDKLSKLKDLDISHNRIAKLPHMGFANKSLTKLNMAYNFLEMLDAMLLSGAQIWPLKELYVEHNNISSVSESILQQMVHLEILHIQHNKIDQMLHLAAVGAALKDVDLSHNLISFVPHGYLDGLTGLETLRLSYNCMEDFPFWKLPALGSLTSLDLGNNGIKSLPDISAMAINDDLVLDVMGNPIICSGEMCWLRNFDKFSIIREDKLCRGQSELVDFVFDDMGDSVLGCTCTCL